MKKILILFGFMALCLTSQAEVADTSSYFTGKWNVIVYGTPQGDAKMLITLERKEGKLTGNVSDPATMNEIAKIDLIDENTDSVTLYFHAGGYDVNMFLKKKDDKNAEGTLMGMFEAKAERVP